MDDLISREVAAKILQARANMSVGTSKVKAQQPRWISVKERLPENGQKVIATFKNEGGIIVDQARYSNGEFDFASWAYVWHENITHWMPMPEPPKEEHHD